MLRKFHVHPNPKPAQAALAPRSKAALVHKYEVMHSIALI